MFTKPLQCCFDDSLDCWGTFVGVVRSGLTSKPDQPDTILLQLWPYSEEETSDKTIHSDKDKPGSSETESVEECVEEYFQEYINPRQCVLGERKPWHFMRGANQGGSYDTGVFENGATYVIITPQRIINCRGEGALDFIEQILNRRYCHQTTCLDRLFYCCTDIGEVDADENEYVLAITSSDIAVVSLHQGLISRSFPFTKIRTYQRHSANTILIQVGKIKFGERTYSFRVFKADEFYETLKDQLGFIASLVQKTRTETQSTVCNDVNYENDATTLTGTSELEYSKLKSVEDLSYTSEEEFRSYSDSTSYDESTRDSSYSSYCTDIHPFFSNSFDSKEFSYERLSSSIDRRSSAPETNIIYQDVDTDFRAKHHSGYFTRQFSKVYTKPTFISYIEGGTAALESVRRRFLSEPLYFDVEGSGVYSKPFDPELIKQEKEDQRNERGYDVLKVRPKSIAQ